ncbi:MAG: hypothetical protein FWC36_02590 [Spirochaetes bacterium]|nr:hypothetical protein [Spirochaetota bacterium]
MNLIRLVILLLIIVFVILISLFIIDRFGQERHRIVLWTDIPEFIIYIEMFNSENDRLKIKPVYVKDPAKALIRTRRFPDLVVGSYLNSPQVIDNFRRTNHLLRQKKINRNSFYRELLSRGARGRNQLVLPVSFNMPALMFQRDTDYNISNFKLTHEDIIQASRAFNERRSEASAFSPRWNSNMLYYSAVMNNANFRATSGDRAISYNMDGIEEALREARAFINNISGGIERDRRFQERHLFKPAENLISEQRILFALTDLRSFYAIRQQKREQLDFRWISKNNRIPVRDDIVYIGIPRSASNRRGAEKFLTWFFDYTTQENIMDAKRGQRIRPFGIAGGFSSLRNVNEQVFPRHYPLLVGHVPPPNMLIFPAPLPVEWESLKNDVINRWLYNEAGNPRTTSDLDAAIANWYRFQLRF